MAIKEAEVEVTEADLARIWQGNDLGQLGSVTHPVHGSINHCLIINDQAVIRFNVAAAPELSRFRSEQIAYARLRGTGVPVPVVLALDTSRQLVPYDYLITTRLAGKPVVDSWPELSEAQQQQVAYHSGKYLAWIHSVSFSRFGPLRSLHTGGFKDCYAYTADYFRRYAGLALGLQGIDARLYARIEAVLFHCKPLLDRVTDGVLVHSDYHFENILQEDGIVTGVIDFEWAFAGDPAVDWVVEDKWDDICPGSQQWVYAGYASQRPADPQRALTIPLYKLLTHLETVVDTRRLADNIAYEHTMEKLLQELHRLEEA